MLVLHYTGMQDAASAIQRLSDPEAKVSSHYLVAEDGQIIRMVAEDKRADVIGMSGLLVKSTVVMKENLEELNTRGLGEKYPVLLGGAALTRAYVENDLTEVYEGEVSYAREAFEGLRLMDEIMSRKRGEARDE